jgi:hypothetical protein
MDLNWISTIDEGIEKCFCIYKDLKGIPLELAQHKIEYYYIVGTSGHVQIKSKLCYSDQKKIYINC